MIASQTKAEAEARARTLVNKWCMGAAGLGLIPGVGLVLTAGDYVLAKNVASIFGIVDADAESTMAALAGSIVGRTTAGVLSFIPFVNSVAAAGTTKAVGEAVINHYKSLSRLP
jgi:hypothetical protein